MNRVKFSPSMLKIIHEAARKCFGQRPVVPYRTGFKILERKPVGPIVAEYYDPEFAPIFRKFAPEYKTEIEERRFEKLIKLRAKNKGPPKKGQGKRSKKKVKK